MGKRKNSIFITPLFIILTVTMFIMAIVSYWWNHYIFVAELILAIAALVAVFISMMNYKDYLAKIVTDAANSAGNISIDRINKEYCSSFNEQNLLPDEFKTILKNEMERLL